MIAFRTNEEIMATSLFNVKDQELHVALSLLGEASEFLKKFCECDDNVYCLHCRIEKFIDICKKDEICN